MIQALLLLKPLAYVGVLAVAAWRFRSEDGPSWLRLGLLGLGRAIAGLVIGVAFVGLADRWISAVGSVPLIAVIGAFGLGLWLGTGKLAFRSLRAAPLALFAVVAEVISLGWDFALVGTLARSRAW
jgi:hypothetical protein